MVVAGGYARGEYFDSVEIYKSGGDGLWETLEDRLPTPRMLVGGVVGGQYSGGEFLYMFGKY